MAERDGKGPQEATIHRLDQGPARRAPGLPGGGPSPEPPGGWSGGTTVSWGKISDADHLPTLSETFSLVTEQYRMLRLQLDGMARKDGAPMQVVAFSSALPGEGKTCTALNTAITASREVGRRVLYVECDLRRQRVRKLLANPPATGLTDVLEGESQVADVILNLDRPDHLSLILAGRSPSNPVELLGAPAMGETLAWLRERFDLVVLDTPPALNFADAGRLGVHVDGVVMVVRIGHTPREALAKTHRLLSPYNVLGVVINDMDLGPGSGYGYYYQGYYGHAGGEDED